MTNKDIELIVNLIDLIKKKCPNITNEQLIEILQMIKRKNLDYEDVENALTDDNYSFESIKKIISSLKKKPKQTSKP